MQRKLLFASGALILLVLVIISLTKGKGVQPPQETNIPVSQEIIVEGTEFKFSPDKIELEKGKRAKITFQNKGEQPHNLLIPELNIATRTIGPGEEDTVVVEAKETGSYTFYCGVANHKDLGMEGGVEVK